MNEKDFDQKTEVILDKMREQLPHITTRDIPTVVMFCTMFKDEYYGNENI